VTVRPAIAVGAACAALFGASFAAGSETRGDEQKAPRARASAQSAPPRPPPRSLALPEVVGLPDLREPRRPHERKPVAFAVTAAPPRGRSAPAPKPPPQPVSEPAAPVSAPEPAPAPAPAPVPRPRRPLPLRRRLPRPRPPRSRPRKAAAASSTTADDELPRPSRAHGRSSRTSSGHCPSSAHATTGSSAARRHRPERDDGHTGGSRAQVHCADTMRKPAFHPQMPPAVRKWGFVRPFRMAPVGERA
jgi:translation initiation factor IF-2